MSYGLAQARYASDASQTASPAKLLVMLYDRLLLDLNLAGEAMQRGDIMVTGERIGHACDILLELYSTLDIGIWPQGEALAQLYLWMVQRLMQSRVRRDPALVAECRDLVLPLRDAWHAAAGQFSAPPALTTDGAA